MSPSSLNTIIDQFGDFPSESTTDHHITEPTTTAFDPDTSQRDTQTLRRSMRQIQRPSKYKRYLLPFLVTKHPMRYSMEPPMIVLL